MTTTNPALSPIIKALEAHHEILRELEGSPHLLNKSREALTKLRSLLHSEAQPSAPLPQPEQKEWVPRVGDFVVLEDYLGKFKVHGIDGEWFDVRSESFNASARLHDLNPWPEFASDFARPPYPHVLHNPDNLTPEQVGEGYRLLLKDEVDGKERKNCDWWNPKKQCWREARGNDTWMCDASDTIRLPLSTPWPDPPQPEPSQEKWAREKAAFARGEKLEFLHVRNTQWLPFHGRNPSWDSLNVKWRIKEVPTPPRSAGEAAHNAFWKTETGFDKLHEEAKVLWNHAAQAAIARRDSQASEVVETFCPPCAGTGSVEIQSGPYFKDCPDCKGTGKRKLHPLTDDLVNRFAAALKEKLFKAQVKYGHGASWTTLGAEWSVEDCQQELLKHLGKGDPRDVAAYCAFLWDKKMPTVAQKTEGVEVAPSAVDWSSVLPKAQKMLDTYDQHPVTRIQRMREVRSICMDALSVFHSSLLAQKDAEIKEECAKQDQMQDIINDERRARIAAESRAESLKKELDAVRIAFAQASHNDCQAGPEIVALRNELDEVKHYNTAIQKQLVHWQEKCERQRDANAGLNAAQFTLKNQMAKVERERDEARQQLAASGSPWVNSSEELPTGTEKVLCKNGGWIYLIEGDKAMRSSCTHWMPIPPLPPSPVKEGGEGRA